MLDLSRLTDLVGSLVGNTVASGGAGDLVQRLGDLGLDTSQFDGLASQELMALISEHGLDLSQIDAGTLATLAEQAGIELPFAEVIDTFTNRPGAE